VLDPVEARLMAGAGVLLTLAALFAVFPRLLAYPVAAVVAWFGFALFLRGYRLRRENQQERSPPPETRPSPGGVTEDTPMAEGSWD
jgi:hypothetical protein